MKPVTTIGLFAVALAAVFTGGAAAGKAVGPIGEPVSDHSGGPGASHGGSDHAASGGAGHGQPGATRSSDRLPGGLMVSSGGYTLQLDAERVAASPTATLSFTVRRPDGSALRDYTPAHGKDLHLIVVRRDLSGYQHLHPVRDRAGRWTSPVNLAVPGTYRVFADLVPAAGDPVTLGADLAVPGDYQPSALPPVTDTATVGDYTVQLSGRLSPGQESPVVLAVLRGGRPVTDLEPYLGAYGHLVALRAGDLAYLHVHPAGHPGDGTTAPGPGVDFTAAVPSAGVYRLYFDFKHEGVVRTAEFTVRADAAGVSATAGGTDRPGATRSPSTGVSPAPSSPSAATGHDAAPHTH